MVLAIGGFGSNSPQIFETALSQNTFWYTCCSLDLVLSAQLLSQNIPRSLILYSIPRSLVPLTIYPHAPAVAIMRVLDIFCSKRGVLLLLLTTPDQNRGKQIFLDFKEIFLKSR